MPEVYYGHVGDVSILTTGTPGFILVGEGSDPQSIGRPWRYSEIFKTILPLLGGLRANIPWATRACSKAARKGSLDIYELTGLKNIVDVDRLHNRKLYEDALAAYFARSFWDAAKGGPAPIKRSRICRSTLSTTVAIRCTSVPAWYARDASTC
jgi:hypothetical protein